MNIRWDWVPTVSVGPFRFGDPATDVVDRLGLRKLERDCSIAYWDTYELPGWESRITVEDDGIAAVLCCDSCVFDEIDLLGMPFTDARQMLGPEDGWGQGVGSGRAAYYSRLGLTLWIDEGGIIDSATCERIIED